MSPGAIVPSFKRLSIVRRLSAKLKPGFADPTPGGRPSLTRLALAAWQPQGKLRREHNRLNPVSDRALTAAGLRARGAGRPSV